MKKTFVLLLALFMFNVQLKACLNELRVQLNGKAVVGDDVFYIPEGHRLKENKDYYLKKLHIQDSLWRADKKIEDYLDYGVNLVYLGRYKEAKAVFLDAEKMQSGLYSTAANLGTTYELLGENELALKWTRKAVEIDPESHGGSEWLHVKILEAKIKGERYITSNFLINTNFGNELIPVSNLSNDKLQELRNQIFYQLYERVSFVKPKDQIVALLLFDLGNICAVLNDVTSALRVYDEAKVYGYNTELFHKRYNKFLDIHKDYNHKEEMGKGDRDGYIYMVEKKEYSKYIFIGIAVFCSVIIFGIYIFIKKRKYKK